MFVNGQADLHPRTAMGYTKKNKLIILVIQGRSPGVAEGATLAEEAKILADLGCYEALNLDGGGSSCMLVNGKETIRPSDKEGQRPVPGVFMIRRKKINAREVQSASILYFPCESTCAKNGSVGLSQMAYQDFDLVLKHLDNIRFHIFARRFQNQITGLCESSKQDYGFRA